MRVERQAKFVYRGAKRWYLNEWSAYVSFAREAYRKGHQCGCDPEVGYVCGDHDEPRQRRVINRLARLLRHYDRKGLIR